VTELALLRACVPPNPAPQVSVSDSLPALMRMASGLAGGDQLAGIRITFTLRACTVSGSAMPSGAP